MIPAPFEYVAPASLDEAVRVLAERGDDAKILAGGHSLIPAMKLRLAQPALLVDIGRIAGLSYITERPGFVHLGAMTTHHQIESSELLRRVCPLLPECAASIGDVQVRNKGTLGGSLAHADPAADWPAAALALGAQLVAVGPRGERTIAADDFFVDMLTTALAPDEILREIRFAVAPARAGHAYMKAAQTASGFAVVGVAVALTRGASGACESARVALTGVGPKAYRAAAVEQALDGNALDAQTIARAAALAADGVDANSDIYASADYRRHLAAVYTRRAIETATQRAKG